jgi:hypothetical protein
MNMGEMLGIYEMEIKHSKQFRAFNTWEISLVTLTVISLVTQTVISLVTLTVITNA